MKKNKDIKRIAIENLNRDIVILILQYSLNKDTTERKDILTEKLNLLYTMDIINTQLYLDYKETIKSL